jgi:hypothetical protein
MWGTVLQRAEHPSPLGRAVGFALDLRLQRGIDPRNCPAQHGDLVMGLNRTSWCSAMLVMTLCLACGACGSSSINTAKPKSPIGASPTTLRPPSLTVSSTSLTVGGPITVNGGDCAPGHIGNAFLGQDPNGGPQVTYNFGERLGQADAASDGRWMLETTLPAMIIGVASLRGNCLDPSTGIPDFTYSSTGVTVATPYRLQVEPATTVRASATLTVSSVGGGCESLSNPDVYLW